MSRITLRACPFCGTDGKLFSHDMDEQKTIWWVQCTNSHCRCTMLAVDSRDRAIMRWNARESEGKHVDET